jgi:hypothetical protein
LYIFNFIKPTKERKKNGDACKMSSCRFDKIAELDLSLINTQRFSSFGGEDAYRQTVSGLAQVVHIVDYVKHILINRVKNGFVDAQVLSIPGINCQAGCDTNLDGWKRTVVYRKFTQAGFICHYPTLSASPSGVGIVVSCHSSAQDAPEMGDLAPDTSPEIESSFNLAIAQITITLDPSELLNMCKLKQVQEINDVYEHSLDAVLRAAIRGLYTTDILISEQSDVFIQVMVPLFLAVGFGVVVHERNQFNEVIISLTWNSSQFSQT